VTHHILSTFDQTLADLHSLAESLSAQQDTQRLRASLDAIAAKRGEASKLIADAEVAMDRNREHLAMLQAVIEENSRALHNTQCEQYSLANALRDAEVSATKLLDLSQVEKELWSACRDVVAKLKSKKPEAHKELMVALGR
jgi:hypothetical protein